MEQVNMSGTKLEQQSKKKRKKREQRKAKLPKLDTYFVRRPGDEPDFFVASDSGPLKLPAQPGSQDNYR